MKKISLLLTTALLSATCAFGTPMLSEAAPAAPTVTEKELPAFLTQGTSFLTKSLSLKGGNYVPYQVSLDELPATEKIPDFAKALLTHMPLGQLQVKHDTLYATAVVCDWSYPVPKEGSSDVFYPLFAGGTTTTKTVHDMNLMLPWIEPLANSMVTSYISTYNKQKKTDIPENILSFSLRNTTPVSAFAENGYIIASRLIVTADGWTLPFYMKGYVWKKDNQYHLICALAADSEWDILSPVMDELAVTGQKGF